jgi:hypothetical protein
MNSTLVKKIISPLIPYITVGIGLLVLHNAWIALLGYHAGMIIVLRLAKTDIPIKRIYQGNYYWITVITALVGISAGILLYLVWPHLSVPDDLKVFLRGIGIYDWTWFVLIIYCSLVNPLLEEYYWRGYLGSPARGITLNDILFSGYHVIVLAGHVGVIWLIAGFSGVTLAAWFWRQMNRIDGGLRTSAVSHLVADTSILLTIYYFAAK